MRRLMLLGTLALIVPLIGVADQPPSITCAKKCLDAYTSKLRVCQGDGACRLAAYEAFGACLRLCSN